MHLVVSRTATGSSVRFVAAFAAGYQRWCAPPLCCPAVFTLCGPRVAAVMGLPCGGMWASTISLT